MSPYTHAVPIKGENEVRQVKSRKRNRKSTVVSKLQEDYLKRKYDEFNLIESNFDQMLQSLSNFTNTDIHKNGQFSTMGDSSKRESLIGAKKIKSDFRHKKYQNETFTMLSGLLNNDKPQIKVPVSQNS